MFVTIVQFAKLSEYARAGFAFMNENDRNWAMEFSLDKSVIRLDTLDMGDDKHCVFGFREGDFLRGVMRYRLPLLRVEQLGLIAPQGVPYWIANPVLTRLWKKEIERQRVVFRHAAAEGALKRIAARAMAA